VIRALLFAFFCVPAFLFAFLWVITGDQPVDGGLAGAVALLNFAGGIAFVHFLDNLCAPIKPGVADVVADCLYSAESAGEDFKGGYIQTYNHSVFVDQLAASGYEIRRL